MKDLLENIKQIQCPIDEIDNRIIAAYKDCKNMRNSEVFVQRDESLDSISAKAYNISVDNGVGPKIVAMVSEGKDHYVATVIDAYIY